MFIYGSDSCLTGTDLIFTYIHTCKEKNALVITGFCHHTLYRGSRAVNKPETLPMREYLGEKVVEGLVVGQNRM